MKEIPSHFVQSVLPKIGGCVIEGGYLFPKLKQGQKGVCVVCDTTFSRQFILAKFPWISFIDSFNPNSTENSNFPSEVLRCENEIAVVQPSNYDAQQAENLQQNIWGSDATYPSYLYHPLGPAASKLVARCNDETIGFLLGFWGQNNGSFWLESQITGTSPNYRKGGVAKILKFTQQAQTKEAKVDSIHWTVDPLQKPNAFLNYNSLGALATALLPDHYKFQNDLNKVPASRFQVRWPSSLETSEQLKILYSEISQNDVLAKIPENWTEIQTNDPREALSLRQSTDEIFNELFSNEFVFGRIIEKEGYYYLVGKERSDVRKIWSNFDA